MSAESDEMKLKQELEAKKLQLHWLLQITKAINYNLPSTNLFEIYQSVLRNQLRVGKVLLVVNEGGWHSPFRYGVEGVSIPEEMDALLTDIKSFSEGGMTNDSWMRPFDTIVPVLHQDVPLAYAVIGGLDEEVFHSKREIITYIHTITNVIVVAIENKRMAKESIRQAALERELQLAAQMQSMLFPESLVTHSFLDIAATYIPHQSVGGDYYDFIKLSDHEALVCMADVSGKGLSAAMLMSNFQANLHAIIRHTAFTLEDLVTELNACVNGSAKGEKFITFFVARISEKNSTIEYINAGHNPPVLLHDNTAELLEAGTTGLGMFEELPFLKHGTATFNKGSLLFCYTDGITDMENIHGAPFGSENLEQLLRDHFHVANMRDLHDRMVLSFDDYRGGAAFPDDVTFLSVRFN
ncbi:MAG: PP2C family protein-serine/threonine phosphatase [Bacteroidia bacterium]